ncbi:YaaR family protein [Gorillibacterium massiliense]|uniref:YaaR family protein n=1 Tax=Gorillibacterium massiliense TaxID=1280390 RepID=UPI000594CBFC|nr:YaaR family protein [Gorillibacterium massiliense]
MKIYPGWRPTGKSVPIPEVGAGQQVQQKAFGEMMNERNVQGSQEELGRMMEQIQLQADRLARSMTIRELRQYKLLIRRFLEETARKGISIRETRGWDRRGRSKRYKLLEQIDETLTAMADELLETEQGRIDILHNIGEIKGMLINAFF